MTPTLLRGWHGRPALTAAAEYMCCPHTRFTVADPAGPLHVHDGTVCWAPQVGMRGGVWQPESIAERARAGP